MSAVKNSKVDGGWCECDAAGREAGLWRVRNIRSLPKGRMEGDVVSQTEFGRP